MKVLFTQDQIEARIAGMAQEIVSTYDPKSTLFVSLLNGAVPFTFLLMQAILRERPDFHPNVQYMYVSRYGSDREAGELQVIDDLPPMYQELSGKNVVILDDLIDVGGTLSFVKNYLLNYGAETVDCVVLVKKSKPTNIEVDLYGFEAPDAWLSGMGMDDASKATEADRWSPWIAMSN